MSTSLVGLALVGAALLAHGGPLATLDPGFAPDGTSTLTTTHGYISADNHWVCEEIGAQRLATGMLRREGQWLLATTAGLLSSAEGCQWQLRADVPELPLVRIVLDRNDSERVLLASYEGIWAAEGEGDFTLAYPNEGLSLRDFWQREEGRFYRVGFTPSTQQTEAAAVVRVGELEVELPLASGRLIILGVDASDRAYVRAPLGLQDYLYRVSPNGAVEDLLGPTAPIADVAHARASLYVVQRGVGTRWSQDDGVTWTEPRGSSLACLRARPDGLHACPDDGLSQLAIEAGGDPDPSSWVWESLGEFAEVDALSCPAESSFGQVCAPLWPLVEAQLGADEVPSEESPEVADVGRAVGCRVGAEPGAWPWALWLLGLGLGCRRRQRFEGRTKHMLSGC